MFYYLTKGNWFLKKNREKKEAIVKRLHSVPKENMKLEISNNSW